MSTVDGDRSTGHRSACIRGEQQQWTIQVGQFAEAATSNAQPQFLPSFAGQEFPIEMPTPMPGVRLPALRSSGPCTFDVNRTAERRTSATKLFLRNGFRIAGPVTRFDRDVGP